VYCDHVTAASCIADCVLSVLQLVNQQYFENFKLLQNIKRQNDEMAKLRIVDTAENIGLRMDKSQYLLLAEEDGYSDRMEMAVVPSRNDGSKIKGFVPNWLSYFH